MRLRDILPIAEGRVYRVDGGYPKPVSVFNNPSPPQARTLVETVLRDGGVYLRGLMIEKHVFVWDGYDLTHDDVLTRLLPDVESYSSDLTTFTISNYTVVGFQKLAYHPAKCRIEKAGDYDPEASPFVQTVLKAVDAIPMPDDQPAH